MTNSLALEYPQLMARYNRWMNEKIYAVCATISDEERKTPRGAPFDSLHGLLNHLHLADSMWLGRFGVIEFAPRPLSTQLFDDFELMRTARGELDELIENYAQNLTEEKLRAPLRFVSVSNPVPRTLPLFVAVTHFFNHQTHHRGQITALLEQIGVDFGVTDLPMMPGAAL